MIPSKPIVHPSSNPIVDKKIDEVAIKAQNLFLDFLRNFEIPSGDPGLEVEGIIRKKFYVEQVLKMQKNNKQTLYIDYNHLLLFPEMTLHDSLLSEFYRIEPYLLKALRQFVAEVDNVLSIKRKGEFFLAFHNLPVIEKLRDMKTAKIGKLVSIGGTVIRTTEVRPELLVGVFLCRECKVKSKEINQQFKYTEPKQCSNPNCGNRTNWDLSTEDSIFTDWQKIRVQENPSDIPAGSMPRSIDIVLRNEIVDTAKPGDRSIFTGCLIVVPDVVSLLKPGEKAQASIREDKKAKVGMHLRSLDAVSGLRKLGVRNLSYKLIFLANSVQSQEGRFGNINIRENESDPNEMLSLDDSKEIAKAKSEGKLYTRLARSIAPTVFGHEEIKRGILLMLFGGVNKDTPEGIKLRGDINICLVGDPSTAKSQFLKYVVSFLPRAIYTSGKSSTAAGLTASVQRDPDTGEFCLEAGALMLADNGICCIDEFEKMDSKDQVAIHEAMEQQTISITKAGIQATLNARTSILAAANPIMGCYDTTKSLKFNVNISAPIMSRFDLFFVILDERHSETDLAVATHIVNLHRQKDEALTPEFSTQELQKYIRYARCLKPQFTNEAAKALREQYMILRKADCTSQKTCYRITVRQLESMIRLSEALARVHLDEIITADYVLEACRLLKKSIINVEAPQIELEHFEQIQDAKKQKVAEDNKEKKKEQIVLSYDEYWRLCKLILYIVKRETDANSDVGPTQQFVTETLLCDLMAEISTTEQALLLQKKISSIINKLINVDKALYVIDASVIDSKRVLGLSPLLNIETFQPQR